ncbi:MAG: gamma-glutamyltransferase family protein, partial [Panacagrimonas sp.]
MIPFSWSNPYAWPRKPLLAHNVVATSQPLAAQAGLQMLAAGGNAVDAILATAITLSLVEPVSNGIGSDAYALVWDGRKLHGLNASGRSPAAWTPAYFRGKSAMPARGWDTVTVPGCVSAWVEMHGKFGKLPFPKHFEQAIRYGREGFLVSPTIAGQWQAQVDKLKDQPGFAQAFLPGGRAPRAGEKFVFKKHALALEKIAATKGKAFYRGELAAKLEAAAKKQGGALRASDMAAHRPDWVKPLEMDYRGYTLHEIPPNGQGIVALIALGMLEHFDLASHPVDGADSLHLQIEALKLAFADARRYVADIDYMKQVSPESLLDKSYLKSRAKLIDMKRAQDFGHGTPPKSGTVYLTAADASGMMVSFIQSNYMGFGSGVVVDGISLQNRAATFVLQDGHPNQVGPGKRPYQTIIPAFVTRDGRPVMSFGVMGGTMQPQGHAQVMVRIADYGQSPQAACDGPRFRFVQGMDVSVEDGR